MWDAVIDMVCYQPDEAQALLDAFRGRAGQLIVCSTIDVYAKPAAHYPITEAEPHTPLNDYSRNKSRCEHILLSAAMDDLPVSVIRACHVYGPGSAHRGHVVHTFGAQTTFLDRLRKGKPVIVHGDGSSFWTSCHSEDMATAFTGALANKEAFNKAYHATSDECLTWNRYHQLVAEAMGWPAPTMIHIPTETLARALPKRSAILVENFQFNNIFDNSAAKRDLNFNPKISFRQGMKSTIEWVEATGGFEDSATEPWYDRIVDAWRSQTDAMANTLAGADE
jgi:nucleoside-diphosphate-sugar epimerase